MATVVLGSAANADDVVQVASERAWRAVATVDPGRGFRPWFLRIVANTARNDRRAVGRRRAAELRVAVAPSDASAADPQAATVTQSEREAVVTAMNRLDGDTRLVIALRYFEQLNEHEMGDVLACPIGTVSLDCRERWIASASSSRRRRRSMAEHDAPDRLDLVLASVGRHLVVDPRGRRRGSRRWRRWRRLVAPRARGGGGRPGGLGRGRRRSRRPAESCRAGCAPGTSTSRSIPTSRCRLSCRASSTTSNRSGGTNWPTGSALPFPTCRSRRSARRTRGGRRRRAGSSRRGTTTRRRCGSWPTVETLPASLDKWLRNPGAATAVDDLGDGGYVVEGTHIFQTPFRIVAASSVVAWSDGDLTFRLDSTMPDDQLIARRRVDRRPADVDAPSANVESI